MIPFSYQLTQDKNVGLKEVGVTQLPNGSEQQFGRSLCFDLFLSFCLDQRVIGGKQVIIHSSFTSMDEGIQVNRSMFLWT